MKQYMRREVLLDAVETFRHSRTTILVIVYIAILVDNMLLSVVVPIIPEYLFELEHPNKVFGDAWRDAIRPSTTTTTQDARLVERLWRARTDNDVDDAEARPLMTNFSYSRVTAASTERPRPTTLSALEEEMRHEELLDENVSVGLLFASKSTVQLIANFYVGPLTNRVGYTVPLFAGFVIIFLSTLIFAFGNSYSVLFIARAVQGIGSSCSSVSGMGMLAQYYPDDRERGNAMAIALGGLAMGVLIGPPFGGAVYQLCGKAVPFILLSLLALVDGAIQLVVLRPTIKPENVDGAPIKELLKDPYILIAAGAITFSNIGIAMLEPSLPIWMMDTMHADKWELGVAFLPASVSYLIGTNIFGPLGHRIGRWRAAMIGLIVVGVSLMMVPHAHSLLGLVVPNAFLGFAIGMVDSSMFPIMGYLVDHRHTAVYGSVYAIADVAFCVGFTIGPALSGVIVRTLGFKWMLYLIGAVNFAYAPLCRYLEDPPGRDSDDAPLVDSSSTYGSGVRYVTMEDDATASVTNDLTTTSHYQNDTAAPHAAAAAAYDAVEDDIENYYRSYQ